MMQDKKALQCGTSHDLGQNFAKAFEIKFLDKQGNEQFPWQTSWGVSTRLIGAIIMVHGDDKGIILPPRIAPIHVVFVPIWKDNEQRAKVLEVAKELSETIPDFVSTIDDRDIRPAWKYYEWERKGVPLRIEIGPRDIESNQVVLVRRDTGEKIAVKRDEFAKCVAEILEAIQQNLYRQAERFREDNTHEAKSWSEFQDIVKNQGGFISAAWCGSADCEAKIKEITKTTIRCIPLKASKIDEIAVCVYCEKPACHKVIFAQAY